MGLFSLPSRWAHDVASAAMYIPAGLYETGRAVVLDGRDLVRYGDITPERTAGIAENIGRGFAEDFRHPIRNLPFLALDVAGLFTGGATTAARGAAALRVLRGTEAVSRGTSVGRQVVEALAHQPEPKARVFKPRYERTNVFTTTAISKGGTPVKRADVTIRDTLTGRTETTRGRQKFSEESGFAKLTDADFEPVHGFYSRSPIKRSAQRFADFTRELDPGNVIPRATLPAGLPVVGGMTVMLPMARRTPEGIRKVYANEADRIYQRLNAVDRAERGEPPEPETRSVAAQTVDVANQAATLGILYLKPAYLTPNLIGQVALGLVHHHFNPVELKKSWRLHREITGMNLAERARTRTLKGEYDPLAARVSAVTGDQGIIHSLSPEKVGATALTRGVGTVHEGLSKFYSKILDTPFRASAFFYEARRKGYSTKADIERLFDGNHGDDLAEISTRANRAMIDYTKLSKVERNLIRRVVFFYPWVKGATVYGGHFVGENPIQAMTQAQIGQMGREQAEEDLGELPSYATGVFKVGERNVPGVGTLPVVSNPAAASILGTPAETLEAVRGLLTGNTDSSSQLAEYLNPAASAAVAAVTRVDPFTKAEIDPSKSGVRVLAEQFLGAGESSDDLIDATLGGLPAVRFLRDVVPPGTPVLGKDRLPPEELRSRLYPTQGPDDAARQFSFGTLAGRPLNLTEAHSRAQAEKRRMLDSPQRIVARYKGARSDTMNELRRLKIASGGQLPKDLDEALTLRARRDVAKAKRQSELGRELEAIDRLRVDLELLVQMGQISQREAAELLREMEGLSEGQIDGFRGTLARNFFGGAVLTFYRREIRDRQGDEKVLAI